MKLNEAMAILRIRERAALRLCARGDYGAHKVGNAWEIPDLPFTSPLCTPDELAAGLGVSRRFVQIMCETHRVLAWKIGDLWRIDPQAAKQIIRARGKT